LRSALCAALVALCWLAPASAQDAIEAALDAAGVPQIPAVLPDRYSVATTEALPIDGVWRVNTINKRIRIEQGRAYALDRWRHLLVLEVKPDMVVLQNFRRTGAGTYTADDPVGPVALTLASDGNLDVVVTTPLFPVRYRLIRVDVQYPDALAHELSAMNGPPVAPVATAPAAPVAPAPTQPLPGMPEAAPSAPPPAQPPAQPPAPARAPAPAAPPPARDCTPIGIDPDTGLTICA
jgi:hypothetical protein